MEPTEDPQGPPPAVGARGILLIVVAVVLGWALISGIGEDAFELGAPSATPSPGFTSTTDPGEDLEEPDDTVPDTTSESDSARPPSEVAVRAANGTGTPGIAGRVSDRLRPLGYEIIEPTDASRTIDTSAVQYVPGFEAEALEVALVLGLSPEAVGPLEAVPPVVGGVEGADVVVLVGPELDE